MAMNSYKWPNEIFMYKSKPPMIKAQNTPFKSTRTEPCYENPSEAASYIVNRGQDLYSNTYNLDLRDHLNLKQGGNQGGENQAQT
ncbi:hypothetical protein EPI10_031900 [Gossypium australe]|uniref:Uncharacterized protein n=1 Tax=Gossypium australe TaxID=47621 RepID=A0A5B6X547_9ROSI|nr:hypothetical protein EPI10_031900 [Gossypium australe]